MQYTYVPSFSYWKFVALSVRLSFRFNHSEPRNLRKIKFSSLQRSCKMRDFKFNHINIRLDMYINFFYFITINLYTNRWVSDVRDVVIILPQGISLSIRSIHFFLPSFLHLSFSPSFVTRLFRSASSTIERKFVIHTSLNDRGYTTTK